MPKLPSPLLLATVLFAVLVTAPSRDAGAALEEEAAPRSGERPREARGRVTRVAIKKREHSLRLFAGTPRAESLVAAYKVAIGPGGLGPKTREGDMVTPVGRYHVTMHQPSQYKVFLRLDYPNGEDMKRFASLKKSGDLPESARIGGDIGIHGPPLSVPPAGKSALKAHDWTAGCIAVDDDDEITEIARLVRDGTPVDIED